MATYPCTIENGHFIIRHNGLVMLVDTGSPSTIHENNQLSLEGQNFRATMGSGPTRIQAIGELAGIPDLTTLLGNDVLRHFKLLFDYARNEFSLGGDELMIPGTRIELGTVIGVPLIPVTLRNQALNFVLDSGAALSYISPALTNGFKVLEVLEDFYPGIGTFDVGCVNITISVGGHPLEGLYGNAPEHVASLLQTTHSSGILGYDFFRRFTVYIDFQQHYLIFR
jgi:hypothetical protein